MAALSFQPHGPYMVRNDVNVFLPEQRNKPSPGMFDLAHHYLTGRRERIDFSTLIPIPNSHWKGLSPTGAFDETPATWVEDMPRLWGSGSNAILLHGFPSVSTKWRSLGDRWYGGLLSFSFATIDSPPRLWYCEIFNTRRADVTYGFVRDGVCHVGRMALPKVDGHPRPHMAAEATWKEEIVSSEAYECLFPKHPVNVLEFESA